MDVRPRLSVIVPVYNEVGTVRTLLERVMAVAIPKEIIVVDDGSTDGTRTVLEEFRAVTPDTAANRLRLFFQDRNQGKGAAVRTAIPQVICARDCADGIRLRETQANRRAK